MKTTKQNPDETIQPGTRFWYHGMEFVALGEEQGGILAIATKAIHDVPFDEYSSNDWQKSTLRKHLNEEWVKQFDTADLLPFESDLAADDGLKDYGTATDYIFVLSCDLYRKYRYVMPKYDDWT